MERNRREVIVIVTSMDQAVLEQLLHEFEQWSHQQVQTDNGHEPTQGGA